MAEFWKPESVDQSVLDDFPESIASSSREATRSFAAVVKAPASATYADVVRAAPPRGAAPGGMFTWYTTTSALVVSGPAGEVTFPDGMRFEVVESDTAYVAVRGPWEEDLVLQEGAEQYRIEYYAGCYFVQMVSAFVSDFAPDLWAQVEMAFRRKGYSVTMTKGNGSAGFLFDGGQGGTVEMLVPDFTAFEEALAAQAVSQNPTKPFHQIAQVPFEVESKTDHRNLGQTVRQKDGSFKRKLSTHEKGLRYLESTAIQFVICFYLRTKHVLLYYKDQTGKHYDILTNPERIPLTRWPGGQLDGMSLYLSPLRHRKSLWAGFSTAERLLPWGAVATAAQRIPPLDSPGVQQRQQTYEREIADKPLDNRYGFLVCACRDGAVEEVELVCSFVDKVDACGTGDTLPTVAAAWEGHVQVLDVLRTHGADLTRADGMDVTPMLAAAIAGRVATLQFLSSHGETAVTYDEEAVLELLAHLWLLKPAPMPLIERTLAYMDREGGEKAVLRAFLRSGSSSKGLSAMLEVARVKTLVQDPSHARKIHAFLQGKLSEAGDFERDDLRILHRAGLVDVLDSRGQTVLMKVAGDWGDPGAVRALLEVGADHRVLDKNGKTALHLACDEGNWEVATVMAEMGIEIPRSLYQEFPKLQIAVPREQE